MKTIFKTAISVLSYMFLTSFYSCINSNEQDNPLSKEETLLAVDGLLCDDCTDGEFANIQSLGDRAIPFLKSAVEYGLPPYIKAYGYINYSRKAKKMEEWSRENGLDSITEGKLGDPEIIVNNLNATFKYRAVHVLETIGGEKAIQSLGDILKKNDDNINLPLRRVIEKTLIRMKAQ